MPRQNKCGYCRNEGHNITHCNSEKAKTLFNNIRSRAIDHIVLERRPFHERATLLYNYLIRICYVDELKIILSKLQCRIHGNRKELAARFINNYFIRELAYGPYSGQIDYNECRHLHIYAKYWKLLSEGVSLNEANYVVNNYLYLIKQVEPNYKFAINVVMKPVDLTEEQPKEYFECAICMEEQCPILDEVELGCGHTFCVTCVLGILTNSKNNKKHPCCGLCRTDFKTIQVHRQKMMEEYKKEYCYSC